MWLFIPQSCPLNFAVWSLAIEKIVITVCAKKSFSMPFYAKNQANYAQEWTNSKTVRPFLDWQSVPFRQTETLFTGYSCLGGVVVFTVFLRHFSSICSKTV